MKDRTVDIIFIFATIAAVVCIIVVGGYLSMETSADEGCFAYKGNHVVVIQYVNNIVDCAAEIDQMLSYGFRIINTNPLFFEGSAQIVMVK